MRILNNKFRILKGGKIGLLSSIGLVASTLMIGSVNANADDTSGIYFNSSPTNNHTFTEWDESVVQYTNNTPNSLDRTTGDISQSITFAPITVTSYFSGIDLVNGGATSPDNTGADIETPAGTLNSYYTTTASNGGAPSETVNIFTYYKTTGASLTYTLTFLDGVDSADISKSNGTNYEAINPTSSSDVSSTLLTSQYTANLVFVSNNEVDGTINVGTDGDVDVREGLVFGGDIDAGTVHFHSDNGTTSTSTITQEIAYDVNSVVSTTIGNANEATNINITKADAVLSGDDLIIANSNVTINTASQDVAKSALITDAISSFNTVTFTHTKNANGRLSIAQTITDSTFGADSVNADTFTTAGATLNFTMGAVDYIAVGGAVNSTLDVADSSSISGYALDMDDDEIINVGLLTTFKDAVSHTLINTTALGGADTIATDNATLADNSYVIDTSLSRAADGDLIVTTSRDENSYVTKSDTLGHFSNNAAIVFGALGADGEGAQGTNYTEDMQTVLNLVDLDQYGYGNTLSNLAVQAKSLAPIVNTSAIQTYTGATKLVTDAISSRVSDVRGLASGEEVKNNGIWLKATGSVADQDQAGQYDGYSVKSAGAAFGYDREFSNGLVLGFAGGYTYSKTEQEDFRNGTEANTKSYQASIYASQNYGNAFVDSSVSYTYHKTDGTRATLVDRTASYDVDSQQYTVKLAAGYDFKKDVVTLTPFVNVDYSYTTQGDYAETGADALNLVVDELNTSRGSVGLGLKVSSKIESGSIAFVPQLTLGAKRYFGDDTTDVTAYYQGDNDKTKFTTSSSEMQDVIYNAGLGLKAEISDSTSLTFNADYERSDNGDFQGVNGELALKI